MSEAQILLLGFIAGATILLGLPIGRIRAQQPGLRQFLNALATGILLFLLWDVLTHAWEPVDAALGNLHDGSGDLSQVLGYATLFFGGLAVGLLSLVYYEQWLRARQKTPPVLDARVLASDSPQVGTAEGPRWSEARHLALLIAIGIGLHNFGEGLAIGGSAAGGQIALATILVLGFALHNATEGFGIVAPLAAAGDRPSWGFLLLMGLIGGGPTLLGTGVGSQFTSEAVSTLFLTLAAGSILYVVLQLLNVGHRMGHRDLLHWGLLLGLLAGFATDMVVTAGGA